MGAAFWYARGERTAVPVFEQAADQNLLLITIDTLRADALGAYGGAATTPNLDRLARAGIRFTFAHAHAVVTLPSHASILTGRYPFEHGVRDNAGFRLGAAPRTLAEAAKEQGLATGAFVGAFPLDRQFGLARGFDVYDDLGGREIAGDDFAFNERRAEDVVAAARQWIAKQSTPWLAWVHVFDPHSPYAPPPPYDSRYAADPYAGEVAYTDAALAPLLDDVRRSPRLTTIVVTGDHGEGRGDHGEATHGVFAYESTLRIPLIAAQVGAGRTIDDSRPGAVSNALVGHIDIAPTLAGVARLTMPGDLPGHSLLDAGKSRTLYFEAMTTMLKRGWAPLRGVLVDREKYIDLPLEELYDLSADPQEARNLASGAADRVKVLHNRLSSLGAAMPGEQAAESPEVRARLQALGYVSGSAPRKARYTEADDPKRLIDVDRLMIDGIEFHRSGRTGEAIDAYRRVIAQRPDMGLAYRRLAFIQWESGATADAMATLRQGLARIGPDIDIEIRLGTYLAETGAAAQAVPMLERVVSASPEHHEGLNALGIAYARAGRTDDAIRRFERLLTIDSRNAFALENLGASHLQRGDLVKAGDAFARAAAADPRSGRARSGLGVVALKAGRPDEAIEHWRRAVELDARDFDALYNLATTLADARRFDEARPYLERFVRTAPPAFYARDIAQVRRLLGGAR